MVYASRKFSPREATGLANHPSVAIQLPIYNERYVVARLIYTVSSKKWPIDKLQILILDDSSDETSELIDENANRLNSEGYNILVVRRNGREGFKAGALQNALSYTEEKTSPSSMPTSCPHLTS